MARSAPRQNMPTARTLELLSPEVVARVQRWRAQRMSWANIARALGVAEADVRKHHDPSWWPNAVATRAANRVRDPSSQSED